MRHKSICVVCMFLTSYTFYVLFPLTLIQLTRIVSILNQWTASKDCLSGDDVAGEHFVDELNVGRLLDCCRKHIE